MYVRMYVCMNVSISMSISIYLLGLEDHGLHVRRHALAAVGGEPVAEHRLCEDAHRLEVQRHRQRLGVIDRAPGKGGGGSLGSWPLHDIVITNIVWCIADKREVGRGVIYCAIIVQSYSTRVGNAGGRGE